MSDAQSKLQEALAQAKAKKKVKGPSLSKNKPAPAKRAPAPSHAAAKSVEKPSKKTAPPKKAVKKKGPGLGSGLFKNFQHFASSVIDELKTATAEISPGALLATANDGFKSIKKAVGLQKEQMLQDFAGPAETQTNNQHTDTQAEPAEARDTINENFSASVQNDEPRQYTSPAKVQRLSSKKKKEQEPAHSHHETEQPASPATLSETPVSASEPATPSETPMDFTSPAKVQRAASKKKKIEDDDLPTTDLVRDEKNAHRETGQPVETPSDAKKEPDTDPHSIEKQIQNADKTDPSKKPVRKPPQTGSGAISKEEHIIRSFRSLQIVLTNPIWKPIITNAEIKPSSLYAPREHFDALFSDPVFREGLKSASRLASAYVLPSDKMRFNDKIIERVVGLNLDPENKIKSYTENLISVLDEAIVEEVLALMQDGHIKHLLFSVGTRLGMFVPTIESLARIYLGLRKKEYLSSGDRLQIQEEILMRYKKSAYTEEMGKKARNLALNYFMDYLSEYAMKLYKERFKQTNEGQDNRESHLRRHATIKAFCCDMISEWCKKIAVSTPAIVNIQSRFSEAADQFLQEFTGESSVSA